MTENVVLMDDTDLNKRGRRGLGDEKENEYRINIEGSSSRSRHKVTPRSSDQFDRYLVLALLVIAVLVYLLPYLFWDAEFKGHHPLTDDLY